MIINCNLITAVNKKFSKSAKPCYSFKHDNKGTIKQHIIQTKDICITV